MSVTITPRLVRFQADTLYACRNSLSLDRSGAQQYCAGANATEVWDGDPVTFSTARDFVVQYERRETVHGGKFWLQVQGEFGRGCSNRIPWETSSNWLKFCLLHGKRKRKRRRNPLDQMSAQKAGRGVHPSPVCLALQPCTK